MAAPPLPVAPRRPPFGLQWAPLAAAVAAVAILAALAVARLADPRAAAVAAAMVLTGGAGLGWWMRGRALTGLQASLAPATPPVAQLAGSPAAALEPMLSVLDALEDPVLVVSGDEPDDIASRRLIYANAAAGELFRSTREAAPLATVVRDPKVLEVVDEALFGRIAGETTYAAGGAQDRVWRARDRPLKGSGERRIALLTLRDETELRRSERTRADFLANASHELRTPLASLTGFIETLRGHARDDSAARDRFLAIMHDQAFRMARLVEDLMSLSRIELNEHIPPQGSADLRLTVKDVLDALAPLADEKAIRFVAQLPDTPAYARPADRDQLVQVIQNLVENALKYTPSGSRVVLEVTDQVTAAEAMAPQQLGAPHLSLLTPDHAADQRYVMLRVADGGPGISREHLPRLTERFYRVEGQKPGDRSGTGLGLAIVKHIVNRHRGGLTVESSPGLGAAFVAYFPAGS